MQINRNLLIKYWILLLISLLVCGCAKVHNTIPVKNHERSEEIVALLLAFDEREKLYNNGFLNREQNTTLELNGYIIINSDKFQKINELQKYYYDVCTENFCNNRFLFTGATPRWKEINGKICQSMADGIWIPITKESLLYSTISSVENNIFVVRVPFTNHLDNSSYYVDYTLVETDIGLRVDNCHTVVD